MRRAALFSALLCGAYLLAGAPPARSQSDPIRAAEPQFESGNYPAAMATLRAELAKNPQNSRAYYWMGRCYYELRAFDDAATQEERAAKLDPQNSVYHYWIGRAYAEKAERESSFLAARKVKSEFQEAVRLNPGNIQARRDLAQFYVEAPWIVGGSKEEARKQVDAVAALDPLEGHLARGQFWSSQKKPDLAEAEFRLVLQAKPNRVEPYFEVAEFYQRQGKAPDMKAAIEAAAKIRPSDPRLAYYRGAERVLEGKDLAQAEQYLKSYLATTPERSDWPSHGSARELLGVVYEREGKRMEAAEQYRAVLQLDPGLKRVRERLQRLEKGSK